MKWILEQHFRALFVLLCISMFGCAENDSGVKFHDFVTTMKR